MYQRRYESGGQFWPYVAHKMVWCQMLLVVFTALVLVVKAAYTQAVVMAITLPMFLLMFKAFLSSRYDAVVSQIPLMAVHAAAKGSVDPDLYTAPPLRPGAHGWHPEWGKVRLGVALRVLWGGAGDCAMRIRDSLFFTSMRV